MSIKQRRLSDLEFAGPSMNMITMDDPMLSMDYPWMIQRGEIKLRDFKIIGTSFKGILAEPHGQSMVVLKARRISRQSEAQ